MLKEINDKYFGWAKYYTDGSKNADGSGAAYFNVSDHKSAMYKTRSYVSIMTMELIAISKALDSATISDHRCVVICTDSKSALQHLARCASGYRGVSVAYTILNKINNLIMNNIMELKLQWVPSHIGLRGNEEADKLAKQAVTEGDEISIDPNYTELLYIYLKKCFSKYKEYFDERSKEKGIWYKTIQCQPPPIPWFVKASISRSNIILAHRIRSGHIPSKKFAYLIKKETSPNCQTCGTVEDVHHLLMECVRNKTQRDALMLKLKLNHYDMGVFVHVLSDPASEAALLLYEMFQHQ